MALRASSNIMRAIKFLSDNAVLLVGSINVLLDTFLRVEYTWLLSGGKRGANTWLELMRIALKSLLSAEAHISSNVESLEKKPAFLALLKKASRRSLSCDARNPHQNGDA